MTVRAGGASAANADTNPNTQTESTTPPNHQEASVWILPDEVERLFWYEPDPSCVPNFLSVDLSHDDGGGYGERQRTLVSIWFAFLRLTPEEVLEMIELREALAGRSKLPPRASRASLLRQLRKRLEYGHWKITGEEPIEPNALIANDKRAEKFEPPHWCGDDCRRYLDKVLEAHTAAVSGRCAATDHRVLEEICRIAHKRHTLEPSVGRLRLADRLPWWPKTLATSLKRLVAAGYLLPVGADATSRETIYLIRARSSLNMTQPMRNPFLSAPNRLRPNETEFLGLASHPAFFQKALGASALYLLELVAKSPATTGEWQTLCPQVSRATFYRTLLVLKGEGLFPALVELVDDRWQVVTNLPDVLDEIADYKIGDRSTRQQDIERRLYRARQRQGYRDRMTAIVKKRGWIEIGDGRFRHPTTGEVRDLAQIVDRTGKEFDTYGGMPDAKHIDKIATDRQAQRLTAIGHALDVLSGDLRVDGKRFSTLHIAEVVDRAKAVCILDVLADMTRKHTAVTDRQAVTA